MTGPSWTEFVDAWVFFIFSFIVVVGCHVDLFNLSVFSLKNGVRVNVFCSFGAKFVDNDVSFYVDFFFVPHCVVFLVVSVRTNTHSDERWLILFFVVVVVVRTVDANMSYLIAPVAFTFIGTIA
jgi:hypothetical protein